MVLKCNSLFHNLQFILSLNYFNLKPKMRTERQKNLKTISFTSRVNVKKWYWCKTTKASISNSYPTIVLFPLSILFYLMFLGLNSAREDILQNFRNCGPALNNLKNVILYRNLKTYNCWFLFFDSCPQSLKLL